MSVEPSFGVWIPKNSRHRLRRMLQKMKLRGKLSAAQLGRILRREDLKVDREAAIGPGAAKDAAAGGSFYWRF